MGYLSFRRRVPIVPGLLWANLSKSGLSLSGRLGRLTANSRGQASVRIFRGLSYRFGRRR